MTSMGGHFLDVPLQQPPRVSALGVGVHGTASLRDVFRLPDLWQFHLYRYTAQLTVDGHTYTVRPGHVSLIPPATVVEFRYQGRSEHLYAHFTLEGLDGLDARDGHAQRLPVAQDAGGEAGPLTDLLLRAIAAFPGAPAQAAAEVWAALWRVAGLPGRAEFGPEHPAFAAAVAHIEASLAGPLSVPRIAEAAGVSHNHLTRLFRARTGDTVVAYIRRRRLQRARHLLCESTLSIPAVAASVGIADLQAFNKACRRELGCSPRAVRAGTVAG
ncbi:AraC family transcriptional regulator [Streptacidiphilus sp. MAP12-20]|uniref:AraC family transcriptional regulator n=1 Tax=Streptacidiphilus sp. MAP12-20 TaxID=3156299 RepID=UPI003514600B